MASLSSVVPLFILGAIVAALAFVGYHISIWSNELADRGKKTLEKQNMSFTADGGLKVNVQQMSSETYADKTQNILVNTWNNASFPAYKSRLGWNNSAQNKSKVSPSASPRPGASRQSSDSLRAASSQTSSTTALRPPEHRSSVARGASPVPGGWE